MYKLIAIDLDGTLLNSNGIVSNETKKILQEIIDKNIKIVLTSGRMIDSIKTISEEIGRQKYLIAGNGAIVYDVEKCQILYKNFLSKEKILNVINVKHTEMPKAGGMGVYWFYILGTVIMISTVIVYNKKIKFKERYKLWKRQIKF